MTAQRSLARHRLLWVLAVVGVQNVAYTILIPLTPQLRTEFGMSTLLIGVAFAGFTATKATSQPLGGWLADRMGPRAVGIVGLALSAVCTLALGVAHSAIAVITCRLLWGTGEGLAIPALLVLTTKLGRQSLVGAGRAIGWFGSAAVAGMAVGPLVAAPFSGPRAFSHAFLVGGLISCLSVCIFVLHSRDLTAVNDLPNGAEQLDERRSAVSLRVGVPRSGIPVIVGLLGLLDFLNNFIYAGLEPNFANFGAATGAATSSVSIILFFGLVCFAVAAPAAGAMVGRVTSTGLVVAAFLLQVVCLSLPLTTQTAALYVLAFLPFMAAQSVVYVGVRSTLAGLPRDNLGRAFGSFGFVSDLGWVLGPVVVSGLLGNAPHAVLVLWTTIAGAAVLMSIFLRRSAAVRPLQEEQGDQNAAAAVHQVP